MTIVVVNSWLIITALRAAHLTYTCRSISHAVRLLCHLVRLTVPNIREHNQEEPTTKSSIATTATWLRPSVLIKLNIAISYFSFLSSLFILPIHPLHVLSDPSLRPISFLSIPSSRFPSVLVPASLGWMTYITRKKNFRNLMPIRCNSSAFWQGLRTTTMQKS